MASTVHARAIAFKAVVGLQDLFRVCGVRFCVWEWRTDLMWNVRNATTWLRHGCYCIQTQTSFLFNFDDTQDEGDRPITKFTFEDGHPLMQIILGLNHANTYPSKQHGCKARGSLNPQINAFPFHCQGRQAPPNYCCA